MKLTVACSPHIRGDFRSSRLMLDVMLALTPALLVGVWMHGIRSALVVLTSIASCVVFEWLYSRITKKRNTIIDGSAMVTGMLLAMTLPATVPYWLVLVGSGFAVILVKALCGGLGQNIFNPALAARAAMMVVYPVGLTRYMDIDGVTAATPLANMHQGLMPAETWSQIAWGTVGGCIGETSAVMLLIGLVYLLVRKVIKITIPAAYIGTVALLTLLFPMGNNNIDWMLCQVFGGGLMLGAIFMATDYVTSPLTQKGQVVYGIGCGALTVRIRYFGGYNEGVSYAILIMNCFVVLLDRIGRPIKFGAPKKEAAK